MPISTTCDVTLMDTPQPLTADADLAMDIAAPGHSDDPVHRVSNDMGKLHANDCHEDGPRVHQLLQAAKQDGRPVHISAPMVRYSKLPFRLLARAYATDITYTPMILAAEFIRSPFARDSDFTTHPLERQPTAHDGRDHALIAQFAASCAEDFARAADLIGPWVDGVDLNCGCPQSWALKEGIGCSLMENPSLVSEMVRAARARLGPGKSVSVKIRIHKDLEQTLRWVREVEAAGVDYVTVHGRTRSQRSSTPSDYGAIRRVKAAATVPVFANGDVYSAADVAKVVELTGADGVMAARGILEDPALFAGFERTPAACVREFVGHAVRCPMPFPLVLHHVSEMTGRMERMGRKERRVLMECKDLVDLIDWVEERFGV